MSNTPQIFLDGNEHYHPRISTTLQNHNKSVKQYVLLPSSFTSKVLYFQQEWKLQRHFENNKFLYGTPEMSHFVILLLAPEDKICTLLLRCNFRLNFIAHFTVRKNRKKYFHVLIHFLPSTLVHFLQLHTYLHHHHSFKVVVFSMHFCKGVSNLETHMDYFAL